MNKLVEEAERLIVPVVNYPKKGVIFRDIGPLLANSDVYGRLVGLMVSDLLKDYEGTEIDAIVGVDARGFIIGASICAKADLPFIMIRKEGKLPPPVTKVPVKNEYDSYLIEMKSGHTGRQQVNEKSNVVIVDDVLATGETMKATKSLAEKCGYNVVAMIALIDLSYLHGDLNLGVPIKTYINYE